jgi:hypothetical protein
MPMKKRIETRIKKSLLVDISNKGSQQMGVTVNISNRGMCIATTEIFRKRSKLNIMVAAADDIFPLSGMVVWNMKRKLAAGNNTPVGIGIKISEATSKYFSYISAIQKDSFLTEKS